MVVFSKDGMLYTSGSVSKAIPARIPINGPKAKRTMRTKFITDNLSWFSKSSYGEKNVNHERRNVNAMKKNIEEVNSSRYEPANCFRFSKPSPHIQKSSKTQFMLFNINDNIEARNQQQFVFCIQSKDTNACLFTHNS